MKVIAIEGSPRKNGNTEKLARKVLEGAAAKGAETGFFKLIDMDVRQCRGCSACRAEGVCVLKDDMDALVAAIQGADAIVLASPVYMGQVTGTAKIFLDRLVRLLAPDYSSRLNGPKKVAYVYTQGNPEEKSFEVYFDYLAKTIPFLGFTSAGRVVATGTRTTEDVNGKTEAIDRAVALGGELC